MLTDNGPCFRKEWDSIVSGRWGATALKTSTYTPRQNPAERRNKEIKSQLRLALLDSKHTQWDNYVSAIRFSLNSRVNRSTGQSPSKLVFGRELRGPASGSFRLEPEEEAEAGQWCDAHWQAVDEMREAAAARSAKQLHQYVEAKNEGRRAAPPYFAGQLVWVRSHQQSDAAAGFCEGLAGCWRGPLRIQGVRADGLFEFHEPSSPVPHFTLPAEEVKPFEDGDGGASGGSGSDDGSLSG